mmetsp:Transcript_16424/g.49210  ORF Transcript_16424/g.49210 Transcript_16424/m.49210 type:complete len:164 (-) Transcript_16424:1671-2162(-)
MLRFSKQALEHARRTGCAGSVVGRSLVGLQRSFAVGGGNDIHDDFKPQYKQGATASVEETIREDLNNNRVMLYMKGDPSAPMCGFSNMACQILNAYGVQFASRNVLEDPELREGIKKFASWPTIPQLYIKGELVGGSDIMMQLHQSGDLKSLLAEGPEAVDAK